MPEDKLGIQPIAAFLASAISKVRQSDGHDEELLEILENRIVKERSDQDDVETATEEIRELAATRASTNLEEPHDETDNG